MWNIVEVDGKYYYYDSTVSACVKETNKQYYDGLKQNKFSGYRLSYDWFPIVDGEELFDENELN